MIEFKGVYKKYPSGTEALKDINLTINDGEFVSVLGASGAGKSTFLKLIMHEETPNSGEITIAGMNLSGMKRKNIPYLRRKMGIVFQDFRLIPNMTVFDNVAFALRVIGASGKDVRTRVPYVLSLVALDSDKARKYPNQLSGGEQQRVGIARALVNNPQLIILDEPTGNIDPDLSQEIVELLYNINKKGTTIIMVTHQQELVKKYRHRTIEIRDGFVASDLIGGGEV